MSITPELKKFDVTEWPIPEPLPRFETHPKVYVCPQVGLPLKRTTDRYDLKRVWFYHDVKSWHIDEFRRVALYNLMKRNLDHWEEWLRFDSTPKFYKIVSRLRRENDGAVIGVAGPKRSGKSLFGQMVLTRVVNNTPHVLFRYREFEAHVQDIEDLAIGVQIDEDLKATGSESKNLAVHVNNAFETSRKAELWAVCTGVNLSFEGWGDTLDLRLIPWGFNTRFQATRAAVVDKNRDFLGFMVLQRKHRPDDIVYYAENLGSWGEYKPRAIAYSRSVIREGGATGAVDDVTQDRHVEAFKDYLQIHYIEHDLDIPTDIMCRRLYRKAKLPSKSIGYMNEIIQWAKAELVVDEVDEDTEPEIPIGMTVEGWEGLRADLERISKENTFALYTVPEWPKMSYAEVGAELGVSILPDSLGKRIRNVRRRLPTKVLGDAGERWIVSHIDSLGAVWGGGGDDVPDILVTVNDLEVAINVKVSLEEHVRRDFPTTPENKWSPALVVLVLPRLLEIRLYHITGQSSMLNSRKGRLCAPNGLVRAIEEMIENV